MNKNYEIGAESISVEIEKGLIDKRPKYVRAEELLMLENDLEIIGKIIKQKYLEYEQNNRILNSWLHKTAKYMFGCSSVASMIIMLTMLSATSFTLILSVLVFFISTLSFSGIMYSDSEIRHDNRTLVTQVDLLLKLKDKKEQQIIQIQNEIDDSLEQKPKVKVPDSNIQVLIKFLQNYPELIDKIFSHDYYVNNLKKLASVMKEYAGVVEEINEIGKQKTLRM